MDRFRLRRRHELICATIDRQKAFIVTVPDPDNRERAEGNLITLMEMRDGIEDQLCSSAHTYDFTPPPNVSQGSGATS